MALRRALKHKPLALKVLIGVVVELPLLLLVGPSLHWWRLVTVPLLVVGTEGLVYVGVLNSGWLSSTRWGRSRSSDQSTSTP